MDRRKEYRCCLLLLVILMLINSFSYTPVFAADKLSERFGIDNVTINSVKEEGQNSYSKVMEEHLNKGALKYNGEKIIARATQYSSYTGEAVEKRTQNQEEFLYIPTENTSVTWKVNVPIEGLYEIQIGYRQASSRFENTKKLIKINDIIPFDEAKELIFDKNYTFSGKPIINNLGDEVQPEVVEKPQWTMKSLTNAKGLSASPYQFYFKKGENTISLVQIEGDIEIGQISLVAPTITKSYAEIKKEYESKGYKKANATIKTEGESFDNIKGFTNSNLQLNTTGDPSASPASYKHILMNMIGNASFKEGGDAITWEFSVPESGLYKLGVRFLHIDGEGLTSGRAIKIDNQIPFSELEDYRFRYARLLCYEALGDKDEDYLFYLEQGKHTLTMEAQIGAMLAPLRDLEELYTILSQSIKDITFVTGSNPDPNYDYELNKKIPDLMSNMDKIIALSTRSMNEINKYSSNVSAVANNIKMLTESFQRLKNNPDIIQKKFGEITNFSLSVSDWIIAIKEQPLGIDYFSFLPADTNVKDYQSSIFSNILGGIYNFFISFVKDYNSVGVESKNEYKTLNVWISRGKEWGEILKEIADNDFTPKEKIAIKLNILPSGSISGAVNPLLLAISSGQNQPDVVLSLPSTLPVEYAMRGVVQPIDDMPNLQQIKNRFPKGLMIPYEYDSKTYALPETSNFRVMFYRKDILDELGIKVPSTWDEVYDKVLPVLYQNNKQMYLPETVQSLGMYDTFLYQNGGAFYKENGTKTALDSTAAFQACEELTSIYTKYGVPFTANFYNRFRTGEIPIGIGNFSTYVSLLSAAPEIASKWSIALIPGKKMEDGSINRKTGGIAGEADIVLKSTKNKDGSYRFLDWWTKKETQISFGKRIEGRFGRIAKWNTSNIEAYEALPINKEHLQVIKETWNNSIEQPIVLGGYFTSRHMVNALNKTIIQRLPVRNAMEEAVEQINDELARKQKEYK